MTIEEKRAIGRQLKKYREGRAWTQEHLAAASGVSLRSVQRAEKGEGVSQENLFALAEAFGINAKDLLAEAVAQKDAGPELRLALRHLSGNAELIRLLRRKGNFQVGPPGEHRFNEHVASLLFEIRDGVDDPGGDPETNKDLQERASYVLRYCNDVGFFLFGVHYREEVVTRTRLVRKPTTIIIAAVQRDPRVRKTGKGFVLDYVVDRRRQLLNRLMNCPPTRYEWMQDQIISKLDGSERVEATLRKINDRIRKGGSDRFD